MASPSRTPPELPSPALAFFHHLGPRDFTPPVINVPTITPPSIAAPSIAAPSIPQFTYTPPVRTDCVTATPDAHGYVPAASCNAVWQFYPSLAAAVIFCLIFGALIVAHSVQAFRYKKKFCWVIVMASSWEFSSFATRAAGSNDQQNAWLATISQILVLLAPLWINAFVYMIFGRLIYFMMPGKALMKIKATLVAHIFVWLDIFSFVIQLIGGFMASGIDVPEQQLKTGLNTYMAGIGIQEFFIVILTWMAIKFWLRARKMQSHGFMDSPSKTKWRKTLVTLFTVLGLITTRIIFRLIEFSNGTSASNPIPFHEAYFYVFDAVPMAIAITLLSIMHPGMILKGEGSEFPKTPCCACCGKRKEARKRIEKEKALNTLPRDIELSSAQLGFSPEHTYKPPFQETSMQTREVYNVYAAQYQELPGNEARPLPTKQISRSPALPNHAARSAAFKSPV